MTANANQGANMTKVKSKLFTLAVTATTMAALYAPALAEAGRWLK
jgi:hypothetical protein